MSKRNLAKARGLNSIADPSDFKGKSGRPSKKAHETTRDPSTNTLQSPQQSPNTPNKTKTIPEKSGDDDRGRRPSTTDASSKSDPDAVDDNTGRTATEAPVGTTNGTSTDPGGAVGTEATEQPKRQRGRPPITGPRRIRRELSVPLVVAEAVDQTGMNPADLVMAAYRRHSDGVFTGSGARLAARGRKRLRISLSDGDFDKITRLGEARNWNRSETVSVLLSLDLLATQRGDETAD